MWFRNKLNLSKIRKVHATPMVQAASLSHTGGFDGGSQLSTLQLTAVLRGRRLSFTLPTLLYSSSFYLSVFCSVRITIYLFLLSACGLNPINRDVSVELFNFRRSCRRVWFLIAIYNLIKLTFLFVGKLICRCVVIVFKLIVFTCEVVRCDVWSWDNVLGLSNSHNNYR